MAKHYDVIVVGAGPAGAMGSKTAGENGLKGCAHRKNSRILELSAAHAA